jgi:hypothetical protein
MSASFLITFREALVIEIIGAANIGRKDPLVKPGYEVH